MRKKRSDELEKSRTSLEEKIEAVGSKTTCQKARRVRETKASKEFRGAHYVTSRSRKTQNGGEGMQKRWSRAYTPLPRPRNGECGLRKTILGRRKKSLGKRGQ